ncbi:MAG: hypothetical protein QXL34_06565 [Thermosphaera sp.]
MDIDRIYGLIRENKFSEALLAFEKYRDFVDGDFYKAATNLMSILGDMRFSSMDIVVLLKIESALFSLLNILKERKSVLRSL